jgi:hypothetical protein
VIMTYQKPGLLRLDLEGMDRPCLLGHCDAIKCLDGSDGGCS